MQSLIVPFLPICLALPLPSFLPPSLLLLLELKYSILITKPKILPEMKATL
jgi:hypothetical protein